MTVIFYMYYNSNWPHVPVLWWKKSTARASQRTSLRPLTEVKSFDLPSLYCISIRVQEHGINSLNRHQVSGRLRTEKLINQNVVSYQIIVWLQCLLDSTVQNFVNQQINGSARFIICQSNTVSGSQSQDTRTYIMSKCAQGNGCLWYWHEKTNKNCSC